MANFFVTSDTETTAIIRTGDTQTFIIDGGRKGDPGRDGLGVPAGGTSGQVLTKNSSVDNDTSWQTPSDLNYKPYVIAMATVL